MAKSLNQNFKDPEFIKKLIKKDHSSIELVVREYTEHLLKASLGLGFSEQEGSELVQNTWITFFDVISNFNANSHIRTFLFGILYNKARELKREKLKFNKFEPIDSIIESRFSEMGCWKNHIVEPEKFIEATQMLEIIEKCLDALPVNQKMVFTLRELDDVVSKDICKILDISDTNLGVLLYRAKNGLRECIELKAKA